MILFWGDYINCQHQWEWPHKVRLLCKPRGLYKLHLPPTPTHTECDWLGQVVSFLRKLITWFSFCFLFFCFFLWAHHFSRLCQDIGTRIYAGCERSTLVLSVNCNLIISDFVCCHHHENGPTRGGCSVHHVELFKRLAPVDEVPLAGK